MGGLLSCSSVSTVLKLETSAPSDWVSSIFISDSSQKLALASASARLNSSASLPLRLVRSQSSFPLSVGAISKRIKVIVSRERATAKKNNKGVPTLSRGRLTHPCQESARVGALALAGMPRLVLLTLLCFHMNHAIIA